MRQKLIHLPGPPVQVRVQRPPAQSALRQVRAARELVCSPRRSHRCLWVVGAALPCGARVLACRRDLCPSPAPATSAPPATTPPPAAATTTPTSTTAYRDDPAHVVVARTAAAPVADRRPCVVFFCLGVWVHVYVGPAVAAQLAQAECAWVWVR